VDAALQHGFTVVTTVRSDSKGEAILKSHPNVARDRLSYVVVEDIAQEGAFDDAVKSEPPFEVVLHTASPFFFGHSDPIKEILDPAIKGTTGILKSIKANAPAVKHVVVTSSFAALRQPQSPPTPYNEEMWNPVTKEQSLLPGSTYMASKTFAERAAWDFVKNEKPNFSLSVLNPPLVLGPVIHDLQSLDKINTSNERVRDIVLGKFKGSMPATTNYLWVDVRDLAEAHIKAIQVAEAAGHRFFTTAGYFSNKRIVDAVRNYFPQLEGKLPAADTPDDLPQDVFGIDNSKSIKVLGLEYRSLEESIKDTVDSILKFI
jgi:nucleoside-diphosphate-sugar epimerase